MDQPKQLTTRSHRWNPLKQAVLGLQTKLSRIREVLDRAGWNGWIEREDDEVWRWLKNVRVLEEEIRVELEKWQSEIVEAAVGEDPVKVLCSIPSLSSCIKRLKVRDRILLKIIKELSGKIESGFRDDDVMKFIKLSRSFPDSVSAYRNNRPVTTCEFRGLPVLNQKSRKDYFVNKYFCLAPDIDDDIKIISIEGFEGRGKTALAQMVYNDEKVLREPFQIRKWVCVGHPFDDKNINRVRRELVESEEDVEIVNDDDVANILYRKRFLLVFDDVQDEKYNFLNWPSLKCGAPGSRILVTSRVPIMTTHNHTLYPLSISDCWSILKETALSGRPQLRRELRIRDIRWKFAAECRGSPLAAKIVGDYLKSKVTAKEWEDALSDEIMGVLSILRDPHLSNCYEKLSPQLKECFAHFALFPKHSPINVELLIALWAATGCIVDTDHTRMEKRGYDVLKALEQECMLYADDFTRSIHKDKLTSCKISVGSYRVAHYTYSNLTMLGEQNKLYSSHLGCSVIFSHGQLPKDLFTRFKYVKALVLSSCHLEELPSKIGSLDLLQFLDLSGNPLKLLPETIGDLKCLQSLHVHSCYLLLALPRRIEDLEHLRNLRINYTTDELHNLPKGFDKLTSIRTLDIFRVGGTYENIGLLRDLNHLIDIRIVVHGVVHFSDAHLESKSELQNLELCFVGKGRDQEMAPCVEKLVPPPNLQMLLIENYHGLILPMWILDESIISNLKRLSLGSAVNIDSLPTLWKLSNLEFLWIYEMPKIMHLGREFFGQNNSQNVEDSSKDEDGQDSATNREITEEGHGKIAFPSLKTLRFEYLQNWKTWEDIDVGEADKKGIKVMPCLEELIIANCPKFQGKTPFLILRDTPWSKKKQNPSTSKDKETENQYHGDDKLHHMNDQTNDNPSTSNSKGKESEIESVQDKRGGV